ncbi:MAG: PAS domain S-box protein, partial [Actinomycetota bacterium]|nr:PAS domain S-box protein [Actinomycetota bacterium]
MSALLWLLIIEGALAGVIRVRVLIEALSSGGRFSLVEAASAIGLLVFPAILYAIVRLREAQQEMQVFMSDEQQSSHATRVLLDTTTEGIYGIDVNGRCTMANRAAGQLLKCTPEELIGKAMHDLIHHSKADNSTYPVEECPIHRAITDGEGCEVEDEVFWRRDGTSFSAAYSSNPIVDSGGVHGAVVTFRDIDERKRMEQAIRDGEQRVLSFMQELPIGVFVVDKQGCPIYSNYASQDLLGAVADSSVGGTDLTEAYGLCVAGSGHPYPTPRLPVIRALAGETVTVDDIEVRRPDGHAVPLEVWAGPIRDENGEIRYAAAAFTDVSARRTAEAALRASEHAVRVASEVADRERRAAERANLAKSEFLPRMSHELRTPLNGILGFGQLLAMDDLTSDQAESVTELIKGGRHLLQLIDEVLDISSIEAGRMTLSLEPVSIHEVIDESVSLVTPLADHRRISIALPEKPDALLHVFADRQRLKQVLLNLLSNAIKYNSDGGKVWIACNYTADSAILEVGDDGPGISRDKLERLFVPFDRLGAEQSGIEGTGLGLALSKKMTEAIGGELSVRTVERQGTTFSIRLRAAVFPPPVEQVETADAPAHLFGDEYGSHTLLYVEDNLSNLKLVEHILSKRPDVELLSTLQGGIGLELAREHIPDLILLDVHLPDM